MNENCSRTIEAYDAHAVKYAEITRAGHPETREALRRFADSLGEGGRVLEVASGPGWDADALEDQGLSVRRTDLSEGFIHFQRSRGKTVDRLDMMDGDLGGPWDGLVALYVMQYVDRDATAAVVARMAAALRPGGVLLTSFQQGHGECAQTGAEGGTYHVVRRSPSEMREAVEASGLHVIWRHAFQGSEAPWVLVIARRP